jgi:Protein of unknown function (DUF1186)/SEC-C motif
MDPAEIMQAFSEAKALPVEAIRAASADREAVLPAFLDAIERCVADATDALPGNELFYIFHLLGEWREKRAYRPLSRLLRLPEKIGLILGDGLTENSHRVMAAVFDGDPQPLYDIILDPDADEFARSRMCEAVAMVAGRGALPREEAARFLRACFTEITPHRGGCFVWEGWQSAIALLGLAELTPLVEQAFARDELIEDWLGFEDFEEDLQQNLNDPSAPFAREEYTLFGDTIAELSAWTLEDQEQSDEEWGEFPSEAQEPETEATLWNSLTDGPAFNRYKDVGRNDLCPCGSGKKFKKCCLRDDSYRDVLNAARA